MRAVNKTYLMTKKIIFIFLLAILACSALAFTAQAVSTLDGLNETAGRVDAYKGEMSGTYDSGFMATKVGQIIGIILSFIGVLFLGLMIYAGITWMMATATSKMSVRPRR